MIDGQWLYKFVGQLEKYKTFQFPCVYKTGSLLSALNYVQKELYLEVLCKLHQLLPKMWIYRIFCYIFYNKLLCKDLACHVLLITNKLFPD